VINYKVVLDLVQETITLPKVFETYRADFGGTDAAILKYVFSYLIGEQDIDCDTAI
jgi:hypothetical protein